jgi:hypothetical protein
VRCWFTRTRQDVTVDQESGFAAAYVNADSEARAVCRPRFVAMLQWSLLAVPDRVDVRWGGVGVPGALAGRVGAGAAVEEVVAVSAE